MSAGDGEDGSALQGGDGVAPAAGGGGGGYFGGGGADGYYVRPPGLRPPTFNFCSLSLSLLLLPARPPILLSHPPSLIATPASASPPLKQAGGGGGSSWTHASRCTSVVHISGELGSGVSGPASEKTMTKSYGAGSHPTASDIDYESGVGVTSLCEVRAFAALLLTHCPPWATATCHSDPSRASLLCVRNRVPSTPGCVAAMVSSCSSCCRLFLLCLRFPRHRPHRRRRA